MDQADELQMILSEPGKALIQELMAMDGFKETSDVDLRVFVAFERYLRAMVAEQLQLVKE